MEHGLDVEKLREAIQTEYSQVATTPDKGFHFHTGRSLAAILGYDPAEVNTLPSGSVASFAGTGNPFRMGRLQHGEYVIDIGSGAGFDSLLAAQQVGTAGQVVGIDMTPAMLEKAREGARQMNLHNVEFRQGFAEALPIPDAWADVIISNGVLNLMPDKTVAVREMIRVLRPSGRLQIGDILVQKPVPQNAKRRIDLWTG